MTDRRSRSEVRAVAVAIFVALSGGACSSSKTTGDPRLDAGIDLAAEPKKDGGPPDLAALVSGPDVAADGPSPDTAPPDVASLPVDLGPMPPQRSACTWEGPKCSNGETKMCAGGQLVAVQACHALGC